MKKLSAPAAPLFLGDKLKETNVPAPIVQPPGKRDLSTGPEATPADARAYQGKVNYTEKKSRAYQNRSQGKNRAELRLIERAFRLIPPGRVLDAPCGGGRVSLLLSGLGHQLMAADTSEPMCAIARENFRTAGANIPVEVEDVEKLSYPDRSCDTVICFRLFHHFPEAAIRQRVVKELSRVARRFVALSYFNPYSPTSLQRRWQAFRTGRLPHKRATSLAEVEEYFRQAGFGLVKDFAQFRFIHTLHLAVFERRN